MKTTSTLVRKTMPPDNGLTDETILNVIWQCVVGTVMTTPSGRRMLVTSAVLLWHGTERELLMRTVPIDT